MQSTRNTVIAVEPASRTMVRSSDPHNRRVHAVCHHSERYLSRNELGARGYESGKGLFAQHDFPGVPHLDALFRSAAHSHEQQHHKIMPHVAVAFALIALGVVSLLVTAFTGMLQRQPVAVLIPALIMIGLGAGIYWKRHEVYHWLVKIGVPAQLQIADFPLMASYDITASEDLVVHLGNHQATPPVPTSQYGLVTIDVYPDQESHDDVQDYLAQWENAGFDGQVYAGLVSFEQAAGVDFDPAYKVNRNHRLSLITTMPDAFKDPAYRPSATSPLLNFGAAYTLKKTALYTEKDPVTQRFPLECIPYVDPQASCVLNVQFRWLGGGDGECWLEECRLKIPTALNIEQVDFGRYERQSQEAVWQGIVFAKHGDVQTLTLAVRCTKPILRYHGELGGRYGCVLHNSTLSKLTVTADQLWNPLGLKAAATKAPYIEHRTRIEGDITIDTTRLTQEHEYTRDRSLSCQQRNKTAAQVAVHILDMFQRYKVNLLRVSEAAPRLDPSGTLYTELYYWDIIGRLYAPTMMTPIDIHVVIKSEQCDPLSPTTVDVPVEYVANVELYLRALHDPRDSATPTYIDTLVIHLGDDMDRAIN